MSLRPLLFLLALAACAPPEILLERARLATEVRECDGPGDAGCVFRNAPVALIDRPVRLPGRILTFYPMARTLDFVDNEGKRWQAPGGTLTDGASIPLLFVPIVGSPRTPEFRNAAALHDAYCGIGNEAGPVFQGEPWPRVHRMFYDALVVGGTAPVKAKVMFAAVWIGGPRWHPKTGREDRSLSSLPPDVLEKGLRRTKAFIEATDPAMPRLMRYLDWIEREMIAEGARRVDRAGAGQAPAVPPDAPPLTPAPVNPVPETPAPETPAPVTKPPVKPDPTGAVRPDAPAPTDPKVPPDTAPPDTAPPDTAPPDVSPTDPGPETPPPPPPGGGKGGGGAVQSPSDRAVKVPPPGPP